MLLDGRADYLLLERTQTNESFNIIQPNQAAVANHIHIGDDYQFSPCCGLPIESDAESRLYFLTARPRASRSGSPGLTLDRRPDADLADVLAAGADESRTTIGVG
jgi:hypothetical protein